MHVIHVPPPLPLPHSMATHSIAEPLPAPHLDQKHVREPPLSPWNMSCMVYYDLLNPATSKVIIPPQGLLQTLQHTCSQIHLFVSRQVEEAASLIAVNFLAKLKHVGTKHKVNAGCASSMYHWQLQARHGALDLTARFQVSTGVPTAGGDRELAA